MAGIKITSTDQWFSKCVRIRSEWTCERCKTEYVDNTRGLDCSHFYGRAAKGTRYDPINAFAHCRGCHQWLSSNPDAFVEHYREIFGEVSLEKVREHHRDVLRGKAAHKEIKEIARHYKEQYERMATLRLHGQRGRIEFTDYFERELFDE